MISVIVPVYKVEPYLRRCVDSILAQTYADFELILVDDGSPDNCGAICDSYAEQDARVRVIHQENGGLSAARNAGIEAAQGEYLTFIDSDDLITVDCLEILYLTLNKAGADIAVGDMQTFEDGEDVCTQVQPGEEVPTVMSGREACLSIYRMDGKVPVMAWGKLYKAGLFEGIRYPVGMIHEDDATTPKLLYRAKKVTLTSDRLYCYRQRQGSIMSSDYSVRHFDIVFATDKSIQFLMENGAYDIVEKAEVFKEKQRSLNILKAYQHDLKREIPKEYRIPEWRAIWNLKKILEDEKWEWYMYPFYPKLVIVNSYFRKLKSMIKIIREKT